MYQGKTYPISITSLPNSYGSALPCWAASALLHCLGRAFDSDPHLSHPHLTQTENLLGSYFPKKISELDAFLKVLGLGRQLESRDQGRNLKGGHESEEVRGMPLPPVILLSTPGASTQ